MYCNNLKGKFPKYPVTISNFEKYPLKLLEFEKYPFRHQINTVHTSFLCYPWAVFYTYNPPIHYNSTLPKTIMALESPFIENGTVFQFLKELKLTVRKFALEINFETHTVKS